MPLPPPPHKCLICNWLNNLLLCSEHQAALIPFCCINIKHLKKSARILKDPCQKEKFAESHSPDLVLLFSRVLGFDSFQKGTTRKVLSYALTDYPIVCTAQVSRDHCYLTGIWFCLLYALPSFFLQDGSASPSQLNSCFFKKISSTPFKHQYHTHMMQEATHFADFIISSGIATKKKKIISSLPKKKGKKSQNSLLDY